MQMKVRTFSGAKCSYWNCGTCVYYPEHDFGVGCCIKNCPLIEKKVITVSEDKEITELLMERYPNATVKKEVNSVDELLDYTAVVGKLPFEIICGLLAKGGVYIEAKLDVPSELRKASDADKIRYLRLKAYYLMKEETW